MPSVENADTEVIEGAGWLQDRVRVPDEDAEARLVAEKLDIAKVAAGIEEVRERVAGVVEWRRVADVVSGAAAGQVLGGPWPVRVFTVVDGSVESPSEMALWRCLGALMETGAAWTVRTKQRGPVRDFLVTWSWARLIEGGAVLADEIAVRYDREGGGV